MSQEIYQVDAFTNKPFAGNPAAVCIMEQAAEDEWMQAIAAEMNLSETAFLLSEKDGYQLRWFTPAVEVDLCGHATLASAHILWETGVLPQDRPARFYTRSGPLGAARKQNWIELDFPAEPEEKAQIPENLAAALGVTPNYVGKNRFDYLIEVDSAADLRNLNPDFNLMAGIACRGFIVTCMSDTTEYDFISRFFAPAAGVDEDPVTGSAHCCLGPYWGKKLGRDELTGYQASRRGGIVRVRLGNGRVYLEGQAVTVMRGEIIT